MMQPRCEYCQGSFNPFTTDQRFCAKECREAWHVNERRDALAAFRRRQHNEAQQQRESERA
jgi:hypothetical protein